MTSARGIEGGVDNKKPGKGDNMEPQNGLQQYKAPATLDEAKTAIQSLGRSMAEHAYIIGKHLIWAKSSSPW